MEPKTNYTMVGIIVLILAASLVSALLWLSVGFESKTYNTYLVYINESVHGLSEDSPIKFNGVKIGKVTNIQLDDEDPEKIKLLLKIQSNVLITTSTRATLVTQGFTGTTFLGLSATSPTLTPLKKANDQPYPVIPYTKSFFNQLEENTTTISESLKHIFDQENAEYLKKILANFQQLSQTISENNRNINQSLKDLPQIMHELAISVHDIGDMAHHMSGASDQVSKTMRSGKQSIDAITHQTIPEVSALMQRLDVIAANLEHVSAMMRQNPAVILRGSAPQNPGPGE